MSAEAWDEVELGDVVTLQRGFDLPSRERRDGAVPIVSSSGVTGFHDEAKIAPPGVVTGRYGTLGQVFYVNQPFWPLNTTLYVKDFHGNDPRFCSYLLEYQGLGTQESASAVPGINRNVLHRLLVRRPPLDAQRKIASVLSAYDELIENNRRRIELLEKIADRIYREWFVDFRYPGHEGVPLVETAMGPIPQGWEVSNLGSMGKWSSGGTPPTGSPEYWNGGIPWITSGCLLGRYLSRSDRTLTAAGVAKGSRLVPRDTVLFVVRGMSLAKEFRVGIAECDLAFGQDCKAVQVSDGIAPLLILHYLSDRAPQIAKMVEFAAHGTGKISTDRLKALPIAVPPAVLQTRFHDVATTVRQLVTGLEAAVVTTGATRDLLLQRLISGELDVANLDISIEQAAA